MTRCCYNCRCIVTSSFFLKCKRENVCGAAAGFYKMIHQITRVLCEPLICNASIASGTLLPLTLFLSYSHITHMKYLVSVSYVLFSKMTPIPAEERAYVHDCAFLQRHKIELTLLTKLSHLIVGVYDKNAMMWN